MTTTNHPFAALAAALRTGRPTITDRPCTVCNTPVRTLADITGPTYCPNCMPPPATRPTPGVMDHFNEMCRRHGVDPRYARLDRLPDPIGDAMEAFVSATLLNPTGGHRILLYGPAGTGKTTAALAAIRAFLERGLSDPAGSGGRWALRSMVVGTEAHLIAPDEQSFNTAPDVRALLRRKSLVLMDEWGRATYKGGHAGGIQVRRDFLDAVTATRMNVIYTSNVARGSANPGSPGDSLEDAMGDASLFSRMWSSVNESAWLVAPRDPGTNQVLNHRLPNRVPVSSSPKRGSQQTMFDLG